MANLQVNKLLLDLNIKQHEKLILVKEWDLADANFILTHLIKRCLEDTDSGLCLVLLHNTLGHYHNVGKKLGFDLRSLNNQGVVKVIDLMNTDLYSCETLFERIQTNLKELKLKRKEVTLVIDDFSHFIDLGIAFNELFEFSSALIKTTVGVSLNLIINIHIGDDLDEKIGIALEYNADLIIEVNPLKTGRSEDVSGMIKVIRDQEENVLHYKALPKEIRTFKPGESVQYLFK